MRQARKQKDKTAAVLVLCFCLMALVSVFAVKANIDKLKPGMDDTGTTDVVKKQAVEQEAETVAEDDIVDSRDQAGESGRASSPEFIVPIEGKIIMDYSMDMPIYWATLDQYMTHEGIDIASSVGTEVKSCASGTVTRVDEDDRFGITVEINHGEGLISVYGNLQNEGLIELGEVVDQGKVIGRVGQSSMFEFNDPEHLHFAMRLNGSPVDPHDYISSL